MRVQEGQLDHPQQQQQHHRCLASQYSLLHLANDVARAKAVVLVDVLSVLDDHRHVGEG